ncbi:hypothetical protein HZS_3228 [Henneguya salminicola]|nr:hypothetical protein HZS_3228 [Henneguya salminicola]
MLRIYPNAIDQELLAIYFKIREIRNILNLDSIQTVRQPPLRDKRNGQPFLRKFWEGKIHVKHHTVMIWTKNESLCIMRYTTHTYIDATFRSTPSPFTQCLTIKVYDVGTELNIPCVHALMTSKNEYLYSVVLHKLVFLMEFNWMPKYTTMDLELGMIHAINHEFPESKNIGCYFHFKTAINKKLTK